MGGRTSGFFGFLAVVLFAASTAAAAAPAATVGHFALKLSQALGFQAHNASEAREFLSAAGVTFAGRLADPLTEGEATRVLGDLGLQASPSTNPDRPVSESLAGLVAGYAARGVMEQGGVPSTAGSLPTSCQGRDRSACVQCCLAALGPIAVVPQRMIDLCNNSCTLLGAPPSSPTGP